MSFWRTIARLAARRVDDAACPDCPPGPPGADPAFSTAVTALGAKLARVDGRSDGAEYAAFAQVFQAEGAAARDVRRLYQLAHQTPRGFQSYATRLRKRYGGCPQVLEDVLDGLFHIAKSDGRVSGPELDYLQEVAELFGLSPLTFRRLQTVHLGAERDDPYAALGVPADASDGEVRAAWRRALADAHPDRAAARGLPAEYQAVATAKAAALNAAYQAVRAQRAVLAEAA